MHLVELGPITFDGVSPALTVVLLEDGPCAGRYAEVPMNQAELWQRVGKPEGMGVETRMFSCYRRTPILGRWIYSGITVEAGVLQKALKAAQAEGHTYGESHGV